MKFDNYYNFIIARNQPSDAENEVRTLLGKVIYPFYVIAGVFTTIAVIVCLLTLDVLDHIESKNKVTK